MTVYALKALNYTHTNIHCLIGINTISIFYLQLLSLRSIIGAGSLPGTSDRSTVPPASVALASVPSLGFCTAAGSSGWAEAFLPEGTSGPSDSEGCIHSVPAACPGGSSAGSSSTCCPWPPVAAADGSRGRSLGSSPGKARTSIAGAGSGRGAGPLCSRQRN